jgi:hypothetical protein
MQPDHTVIVHGLGEASAALAEAQVLGFGVTLLSAPGAALYAGCGWWRALVSAARASHPDVPCTDILDCADATGQAMAALRIGLTRLVLWPDAPGRDAVAAIAESLGGFVLRAPPPATPLVTGTRERPREAARLRAESGRGPSGEASGNGDKTGSPG